jgi:hypothetical protein
VAQHGGGEKQRPESDGFKQAINDWPTAAKTNRDHENGTY